MFLVFLVLHAVAAPSLYLYVVDVFFTLMAIEFHRNFLQQTAYRLQKAVLIEHQTLWVTRPILFTPAFQSSFV